MRIEIVHIGGHYADRVIAHLSKMSPGNVDSYQVPDRLPPVLDDAAEYLPAELGAGDAVIAINLHPELLLEIPHIVGGGTVRALIAPIEDPSWVKPGLQRQVTQVCANNDIESAFPKPFCSLNPQTPAITEFCEQFKVGVTRLRLSAKEGKIAGAEVLRGAPCGLTHFLAKGLVGSPADDSLLEKAATLHHSYPCFATMALDQDTGDTIMHASLFLMKDQVKKALDEIGS